MTHVIGNSTHCIDCIHYKAKQEGDHCLYDGFCDIPVTINGRKLGYYGNLYSAVRWQWGSGCQDWVDRETGLTHFEVMTRIPEAKRTPLEIEALKAYIEWKARDEQ